MLQNIKTIWELLILSVGIFTSSGVLLYSHLSELQTTGVCWLVVICDAPHSEIKRACDVVKSSVSTGGNWDCSWEVEGCGSTDEENKCCSDVVGGCVVNGVTGDWLSAPALVNCSFLIFFRTYRFRSVIYVHKSCERFMTLPMITPICIFPRQINVFVFWGCVFPHFQNSVAFLECLFRK